MYDNLFKIVGISKTGLSFCQKITTLWSICGTRSLSDLDVSTSINLVMNAWRARIMQLVDEGWHVPSAPGKVQFMRNCPPVIVRTEDVDRIFQPCCQYHICPWCHSRSIAFLYNKLASFLPIRGGYSTPAFRLLEIRDNRVFVKKSAGKFIASVFKDWINTSRQLMPFLKAAGAYWRATIDPLTTKKGRHLWRLAYSVLDKVPMDYVLPDFVDNGHRTIRYTDMKSRRQLINIVARTCRYPKGMMWGPPDMALVALGVRRRKKCTALYGCFRSSKKNGKTSDNSK